MDEAEQGTETHGKTDILRLTSMITSAYLANNATPADQVTTIIASVSGALTTLAGGEAPEETPPEPAVPIRRSVTPDHLVCLEDGKKLKMLKRYLRARYDMSPEEYRERWGLPPDYPMVAPNYAKQRAEFAKKIGLGKRS